MRIDVDGLSGQEAYKLITGSIVPRPIALVTTVNEAGVVNAAPFSFFNAFAGRKPRVGLGVGEREPGTPKDTAKNIRSQGEFVVHIVDEPLAERMNLCAVPFPPEVSEIEAAGLSVEPSHYVKPPRISASPIHMECALLKEVDIDSETVLFVGKVLCFHVRPDLYSGGRIDPHRLRAVGRLAGSTYSYTRDLFQMERLSYEDWLRGPGAGVNR